jgi:hypothetical protein
MPSRKRAGHPRVRAGDRDATDDSAAETPVEDCLKDKATKQEARSAAPIEDPVSKTGAPGQGSDSEGSDGQTSQPRVTVQRRRVSRGTDEEFVVGDKGDRSATTEDRQGQTQQEPDVGLTGSESVEYVLLPRPSDNDVQPPIEMKTIGDDKQPVSAVAYNEATAVEETAHGAEQEFLGTAEEGRHRSLDVVDGERAGYDLPSVTRDSCCLSDGDGGSRGDCEKDDHFLRGTEEGSGCGIIGDWKSALSAGSNDAAESGGMTAMLHGTSSMEQAEAVELAAMIFDVTSDMGGIDDDDVGGRLEVGGGNDGSELSSPRSNHGNIPAWPLSTQPLQHYSTHNYVTGNEIAHSDRLGTSTQEDRGYLRRPRPGTQGTFDEPAMSPEIAAAAVDAVSAAAAAIGMDFDRPSQAGRVVRVGGVANGGDEGRGVNEPGFRSGHQLLFDRHLHHRRRRQQQEQQQQSNQFYPHAHYSTQMGSTQAGVADCLVLYHDTYGGDSGGVAPMQPSSLPSDCRATSALPSAQHHGYRGDEKLSLLPAIYNESAAHYPRRQRQGHEEPLRSNGSKSGSTRFSSPLSTSSDPAPTSIAALSFSSRAKSSTTAVPLEALSSDIEGMQTAANGNSELPRRLNIGLNNNFPGKPGNRSKSSASCSVSASSSRTKAGTVVSAEVDRNLMICTSTRTSRSGSDGSCTSRSNGYSGESDGSTATKSINEGRCSRSANKLGGSKGGKASNGSSASSEGGTSAATKSESTSKIELSNRRREERNRREQRRSNQISKQIEMLKDILAQGGCARLGKQSNKLTVLNSAADHIRDLQVRVL